jgi:hypothetical protein
MQGSSVDPNEKSILGATTLRRSYHLLLILTFAGIIPFLSLAFFSHKDWLNHARIHELLFSYAAIILTFLGGIQWGIGVVRLDEKKLSFPHLFTLSIIPSLVAWLLLLLHYPKLQLIGFIISFVFVICVDVSLTLKSIMPRWFLMLRFCVTFVVMTLLLISYSSL